VPDVDFVVAVADRMTTPTVQDESAWQRVSRIHGACQPLQTLAWQKTADELLAGYAIRSHQYRCALENCTVDMNPLGSPPWPEPLSRMATPLGSNLTIVDLCAGLGAASTALLGSISRIARKAGDAEIKVHVILADHPSMLARAKVMYHGWLDRELSARMREGGLHLDFEFYPLDLTDPDFPALLVNLGAASQPQLVLHFHMGRALAVARSLPSAPTYAAWLDQAFPEARLLIHDVQPTPDRGNRRWWNGVRDHLRETRGFLYPCPASRCACPLGNERVPKFMGDEMINEMCRSLAFVGPDSPKERRLFWLLASPSSTTPLIPLGAHHKQGTTARWSRKRKSLALCVPRDGRLVLQTLGQ
jgi:hypothetical protein